ncbi:uncharacterized protein LOC116851321 [Odontomachus brunneus]|uniref:uncharacterized protein LOC116851321 n=1 Tax=Odontomachus brunneus TaxID=486640 RepID=UPI0013F1A9D9|nr:uncharacterized protein LOC116851321 [Odontomachus brunneus]
MKLSCSMAGLWPFQSQFKNRILQSFHLFILFSFFPPQLRRLYDIYGKDIDGVIMCISPLFTIVLMLIKVGIIIRFQSKIKSLLCQIETEWERTSRSEENKVVTTYASKTREFCMIYAVIMSNVLICFIISPTILPILDIILPKNETRMRYLAFELNYGIDLQTYWFWLWLHTSLAGVVVIINVIATDTTYITLILHCCYMFAIVRYRLEQLDDSVKQDTIQPFENCDYNTVDTWKYKEQQGKLQEQATAIKQCVLRHKKAIECAQILYHIFAWSLFAGASINVIMISISAVQLVSKLSQWAQMTMACTYISSELVHIFFLNLMAQYILDHSADVHESA